MRKIFTTLCGLMLMAALSTNAENVTFYVEDYNWNQICYPFETEITMDAEGNYVIADFFNSYEPLKFKFAEPTLEKESVIEFTGNLDKPEDGYPYLLNDEGESLVCAAWGLNGAEDWTYIYWPYVADDVSVVYLEDPEDPESVTDYCASLAINGFTNTDYTEYLGWSYIYFWFDKIVPTGVGSVTEDENAPVMHYDLAGRRVENPSNGIFIRKQGSKVSKVAIR